MDRLIKFQTSYGFTLVVGGRFGDIIRTPSNQEEMTAPIEVVDQSLVDRAEKEHEQALEEHRRKWGLL